MTKPEPVVDGAYLVVLDPAELTPEQHAEVRVRLLLAEAARLTGEARRLTDRRRCILLRLRDRGHANELLHCADDLLAEVARSIGEDHTPLPRTSPMPFGNPLVWWYLQWGFGIWNACTLLHALGDRRWWPFAFSAGSLLLCASWRVPPYRLAKKGRWG